MEFTNDLIAKPGVLLAGESGTPALLPEAETIEDSQTAVAEPGEGWRVVLYNDEEHYREEVIVQVMVATNCNEQVAAAIVDRAHNYGQATVTITDRDEAERVADVLRKINLRVTVEHVG